MSWLTRILPYVEQTALWEQAVQAYAQDKDYRHDPPHVGFATVMPLYGCPSDLRTLQVGLALNMRVAFAAYLGVEGRNQIRRDGVLFLDSVVRFADITDGTSNTLLVGERPPSGDGMFGWWYAADGQTRDGSADMVLGVLEQNAYLSNICPTTPAGFSPGQINNLCDALHFWSRHAGGGANFLFADGSVHFLHYSAAPLMPALASRAGGEVVSLP